MTYLSQCQQKTPDWGHNNATDQQEWNVLRPKRDVNIESTPMNRDFKSSGNHILFTNTIENYVDRTHKNLPYAIQTEEIAQKVEVLSLEGSRPSFAFLFVSKRMSLEK